MVAPPGRARGHRPHPDRPALILGLVAADDARARAAGININLWAGLAILAGGAVPLARALLRPLRAEDLEKPEEEES